MTNQWVSAPGAVFLDPNLEQNYRSGIEQFCSAAKDLDNRSVVCVPALIPVHFQKLAQFLVMHICPKYICGLFKQNTNLLRNQFDVKKQLLNYVLTDPKCSEYLENVPLLPLADGSFVSFNAKADPIFVSSDEHPRSLLPGLDYVFVADEYCSTLSRYVVDSGKSDFRYSFLLI